jgi:pimeloyl-ACP methyl ester carboxylesterase
VKNIPALSQRRRVFAADTPGLGASDAIPGVKGPDDIARVVAKGIDALLGHETSYEIVGFSFGATLASLIASAGVHREKVEKLVLLGPASLGTRNPGIELVSVRSHDEKKKAHAENLRRLMIKDEAKVDELALAIQSYNSDSCRLNSRRWAGQPFVVDALKKVKCPTFVAFGERDQVAGSWMDEYVQRLKDARPGVDVRLVPEAGHWVMYEAPEATDELLKEWLP